jgi:hypothetical protein
MRTSLGVVPPCMRDSIDCVSIRSAASPPAARSSAVSSAATPPSSGWFPDSDRSAPSRVRASADMLSCTPATSVFTAVSAATPTAMEATQKARAPRARRV